MRQRFRAIFDGMTRGEQNVLVGLIVIGVIAGGVRYHRASSGEGFKLIGEYDKAVGDWVATEDAQSIAAPANAGPAPPPRLVNINTASAAELKTLNRIGDVYSRNIIEFREANGPFRTVDDLTDVSGIGPKTLAGLRDRVTVGEVAPVAETPPGAIAPAPVEPSADKRININTATIEELDELPGVGPVTAQKIIAHRMRNGPFRSVAELERVDGIGPAKLSDIAPNARVR